MASAARSEDQRRRLQVGCCASGYDKLLESTAGAECSMLRAVTKRLPPGVHKDSPALPKKKGVKSLPLTTYKNGRAGRHVRFLLGLLADRVTGCPPCLTVAVGRLVTCSICMTPTVRHTDQISNVMSLRVCWWWDTLDSSLNGPWFEERYHTRMALGSCSPTGTSFPYTGRFRSRVYLWTSTSTTVRCCREKAFQWKVIGLGSSPRRATLAIAGFLLKTKFK
ncbi:unnamed protein product [Chrysodeixis includens]|uniref:Uncharacterized protein n=1 Tax=Chrysodeixis includens TaxID=689277 RepID=A0A9N8KXS4_CHRIL|nr:unnamed protein product [Chrysodeixis includens]